MSALPTERCCKSYIRFIFYWSLRPRQQKKLWNDPFEPASSFNIPENDIEGGTTYS